MPEFMHAYLKEGLLKWRPLDNIVEIDYSIYEYNTTKWPVSKITEELFTNH